MPVDSIDLQHFHKLLSFPIEDSVREACSSLMEKYLSEFLHSCDLGTLARIGELDLMDR